ncbi:hypothetical protein M9458_009751, partial [Cirrhinus mrigala]
MSVHSTGHQRLKLVAPDRTVDAFGEGPPPKPKPGRSPSSLSLLESRFRQEPKDPEQPRTGIGANPLSAVSSAVSSASIPKFSLFGDDEEEASGNHLSKVRLKDRGLKVSLEVLVPNNKDPNLVDQDLNKDPNLGDQGPNSRDLNLVDQGPNSRDLNLVDQDLNSKDLNLEDRDLNSKGPNLEDQDFNSKGPNLEDQDLNSKGPNLEDQAPSNKGLGNLVQGLQQNPVDLNSRANL